MSDHNLLLRFKDGRTPQHPVLVLPEGSTPEDFGSPLVPGAPLVGFGPGSITIHSSDGTPPLPISGNAWTSHAGWELSLGKREGSRPPIDSNTFAPEQTDLGMPELRVLGSGEAILDRLSLLIAPGSPVVIGRSSKTSDLTVRDDRVSRIHCQVSKRENAFWIEDLGSKSGTLVNGEALTGVRKLHHQDIIRVGQTNIEFWAFLEALERFQPAVPMPDPGAAGSSSSVAAVQLQGQALSSETSGERARRAYSPLSLALAGLALFGLGLLAGWAVARFL